MLGELTLFWMINLPHITYEKAREFAQEQVDEMELGNNKEVSK